MHHHDQPFGDSSAVPTYLLSEITRREVTVALSRRRRRRAVRRLRALRGGARAAPARAAARRRAGRRPARAAQPRRARGALRGARRARPARRLPLVAELRRRAAAPRAARRRRLGARGLRRVWEDSEGARPLDRLLNLNLRTYLVDDLLVKVDRMSMAHGLEVRSPFLDTELVELALRLAPGTKVRGTHAQARAARRGRRPACPRDRRRAASAASASRSIAGFATTSPATSPRRSARPTRASSATSPRRRSTRCSHRHASGRADHGQSPVDAAHAGAVPAPRGLVGTPPVGDPAVVGAARRPPRGPRPPSSRAPRRP